MQRLQGSGDMTASQLAMPMNVSQQGEIRLYTFTLPFLPPSKNVYDAWPVQWKQSAKKKWTKAIADECAASQVPLRVAQVGLAATLVFPGKARRDPQNYAQALWHWVPDALVKCGVLVDDNEGRVQIGPNWGLKFAYDTRSVQKKYRQRTILALTMLVPEGHTGP